VDGSVGLGLFIADEVARAHGGRIEAASAAGRTTFRMFIPRR
jgi:nitrogen-specific signal transduction histidine kinase